MKRIFQLFIIPAVMLSFVAACSEDNDSDRLADYQEMSFSLQANTATGIDLGWAAGDALSIFDGKDNHKFITEESGGQVVFSGTANKKAEAFRALYPYKEGLQRYVGKVSVNIPAAQEAVKDGMKSSYRLMAGYTGKGASTIDMKMMPAIVKLTVNAGEYEIVSLQLSSKNGEALAGDCKVGLFEEPVIEAADNVSPRLTLTGSNLNGTYYIAALPQNVSAGFVLSITDAYDQRCEIEIPAKELVSGEVCDLGSFSDFELEEVPNPNPTSVAGVVIMKATFTEDEFNLISDPSFESYPDMDRAARSSWKPHPDTYRVDGHTGLYAWNVTDHIPGFFMDNTAQCIGFRKNTDYTFSVWAKSNTPHAYLGVRRYPAGGNAERGGVGPNGWSDWTGGKEWQYVEIQFNTGDGCFYGDAFAGVWGDYEIAEWGGPGSDVRAFVTVDDFKVIPTGYDKPSMATVSAEKIADITNATFDEITSIGKAIMWTKADGSIVLGLSNVVINGVEYDSAIAYTEGKDVTDGLVINKFYKEKGVIQPIYPCGAGELSVVPDAVFKKDGKLYMHYFTTVEERSFDDWSAGKAAFLVSEDEGETWKSVGQAWDGGGKYAQSGFYTKDGYTYMVGSAAGRSTSLYDNFFAARVPEGADFTNPANYEYWTGNEYDSEADETLVGGEALLSVGDKAEPALIYNAKFGRYMLIYRSNQHAGLVYRDADSPEGFWSGEKILTNDDVTGKLVAPVVLGVDDDGSIILLATKQM